MGEIETASPIAHHQGAMGAPQRFYDRASKLPTGEPVSEAERSEESALDADLAAAEWELATTAPTTARGVAAVLRYVNSIEGHDWGQFEDESGQARPFWWFLHRTLAAALEDYSC